LGHLRPPGSNLYRILLNKSLHVSTAVVTEPGGGVVEFL
jgi:hypothetical protein